MIEVLKQALEALEYIPESGSMLGALAEEKRLEAITSLRQAIAEAEEQKPVAHSVISGALFDFMGWLTSREERIFLSSADNASPAVEAITEFAKMRNLSLDDAKVRDWHTHPQPKREWVGLTNKEMHECAGEYPWTPTGLKCCRAIEQQLKEKNT